MDHSLDKTDMSISTTSNSERQSNVCSNCRLESYDLTCSCGEKFHFDCIHPHVDKIRTEFSDQYNRVSMNLLTFSELQTSGTVHDNYGPMRAVVDHWKEARIAYINEIADQVLNDIEKHERVFDDIILFQEIFGQVQTELGRVAHSPLNTLVDLNERILRNIQNYKSLTQTNCTETSLDTALLSKMNAKKIEETPNITSNSSEQLSFNIEHAPQTNSSELATGNIPFRLPNDKPVSPGHTIPPSAASFQPFREPARHVANLNSFGSDNRDQIPFRFQQNIRLPNETVCIEPSASINPNSTQQSPTTTNNESVKLPTTHGDEAATSANNSSAPPNVMRPSLNAVLNAEPPTAMQPSLNAVPNAEPSTVAASNASLQPIETYANETNDEFDAGRTRFIQRENPIVISVTNDKFAGTICLYGNQLLYSDYDKATQTNFLYFMRDINDKNAKLNISWEPSEEAFDENSPEDEDRIQDIVFSEVLGAYLVLNRVSLQTFKESQLKFEDFHQFKELIMKRVACNNNHIYLIATLTTSVVHNGDEVIILNYDKEEKVSKAFRDIVPNRSNRGAGPMPGEMSDIAVNSNDNVTIGYRLERRHEVGVCIFNVTNSGQTWQCIKQLLLNDCWGNDLHYTPRMEWCEKLSVFVLVEHVTGHLIMIDTRGQVEGECRLMNAQNRRESPLNISILKNNRICARYESAIVIYNITD